LAREGIVLRALDELPGPAGTGLDHYGDDPLVEPGERVLAALRVLDAEHRFDMIEFPDWRALGFRAIQAKRCGDALVDVPLAVRLHGPSGWQREGNLEPRSTPRELKIEHCERYAFEHADVQLSPSSYMLDHTRALGWRVSDAAAAACPYPEPEPGARAREERIEALAFFGRLERRKGLHLFLDALDGIDPAVPALFLGKETRIDGRLASELIAERLGERPHAIEAELDRGEAIARLRQGGLLAVMPSLRETFGFTVAECVANRIPFVAAEVGGIPEVVDHESARERWLCEPTAAALLMALRRQLAAAGREAALREEVAAACDAESWNDRVEETYRRLAGRRPHQVAVREPVTVTVAVPHFNHGEFLPEALASLAAQTRPPDEVLVVDDGSTDAEARRVFDEQEARFPGWRFERAGNSGPGAVRNRCLERASGSCFLPFDADNVAAPDLIERLARAMELNPGRGATACHLLCFRDGADLGREPAYRFAPLGGPRVAGLLENLFGDTCSLFRSEALRSVGGFGEQRWSYAEDWETLARMAFAGFDVDVLPEPLLHYRLLADGRLQSAIADPQLEYRLRRHLLETVFLEAELTREERLALWECLLGFQEVSWDAVQRQLDDQHSWHLTELERLRAGLLAEVERERGRAEAAERALAAQGSRGGLAGVLRLNRRRAPS
jgi:glycosyltransferase involved in cell wall biosynthesis